MGWFSDKEVKTIYEVVDSDYPFRTSDNLYAHATPLTPDEIKEFTVCSN